MQDLDYKEARAALLALMAREGVTVKGDFVPFSQSRNKDEKAPSLNWRVTLSKNGREIWTGDYMAGCAHCPSYACDYGRNYETRALVAAECETGKRHKWAGGKPYRLHVPVPAPEAEDVFASCLMDSGAIDYATYEDFAGEYGYDADSRKGEAVYRLCLEVALKLRAALGDAVLSDARELANML